MSDKFFKNLIVIGQQSIFSIGKIRILQLRFLCFKCLICGALNASEQGAARSRSNARGLLLNLLKVKCIQRELAGVHCSQLTCLPTHECSVLGLIIPNSIQFESFIRVDFRISLFPHSASSPQPPLRAPDPNLRPLRDTTLHSRCTDFVVRMDH